MAEINLSTGDFRKKAGVTKAMKANPKVDLTAMVDLCFLLIMFFIYNSALTQPAAMDLQMPVDAPVKNRVISSGAITVLLDKNNNFYMYEGMLNADDPLQIKDADIPQLRKLISAKKNSRYADDLTVIIKAGEESNYKKVVDMLDEMTINEVKRYALTDISVAEQQLLQQRPQR